MSSRCDNLLLFNLCGNDDSAFKLVRMRFGFGVGDFITVLQLAKDVRERFVDAPDQFKAISDEWVLLLVSIQIFDSIGLMASRVSFGISKMSYSSESLQASRR